MIRPALLAPLLSAALILAGCSLDYQELAESLGDETPSLRMRQVTVVTVEDGEIRFRIEATELAEYAAAYRRDVLGAVFTEYREGGEVGAEGRADRISFDTRSDDAVLEGNIRFTSIEDETSVTAEYLEWNDRLRRLSGSAAGEVLLERSDGTSIRGAGFSADFPSRTFSFKGGVAGRYVTESSE